LTRRILITLAAVATLLPCAGCIVTTSTYEAKVRETEALRDAYASSNREKSRLAGEVETLSKRVAGQEATIERLSARDKACEEDAARSAAE
jgi:outer membrane murein-binding lipoprotein Lpp